MFQREAGQCVLTNKQLNICQCLQCQSGVLVTLLCIIWECNICKQSHTCNKRLWKESAPCNFSSQ